MRFLFLCQRKGYSSKSKREKEEVVYEAQEGSMRGKNGKKRGDLNAISITFCFNFRSNVELIWVLPGYIER